MRVGLLYPAPLEAALSSAAFHLLRGYLGEVIGASVYLYYVDLDGLHSMPAGSPSLRSLDVILVSVSFEFDLPHVVRGLVDGGVSPWRESREGPIVISGGPIATANPITALGFSDAVLPGEAEPVLDELVEALEAPSREARLKRLADVGLLVPGRSPLPVERVYVRDLDDAWYPTKIELPGEREPIWGRAYPLETSRGCGRGCRFCMEGFIFRPPRHRSFQRLRELVERGIEENSLGKVSFYSLSFFDSPWAERILAYAVEELGVEVSVPSMRIDTLTRRRIELIAEGGQRTLTIAPETGSCRLGRALNKAISRDLVVRVASDAFDAGMRNVKLYLITPLPGEGAADLEDTISLVEQVAREASARGGRVRVSVNPFIPKPHTPLQWLGAPDPSEARGRIALLRRRLSRLGVEVSSYDPRYARAQAAVGRGGWGVERLVVHWGLRGTGLGALRAAAREVGIRLDDLWGPLPPEEDPPWHSLVRIRGASAELLRREYEVFQSLLVGS